jgi:uncharacterized OsmC-like protein
LRVKPRYPESTEYNASTVWDGATGGTISTSEGREIVFDTPVSYGGRGQGICPDEIFVSSILGCLTNTFLDFQRRFEMALVSMHLDGRAFTKFDGSSYRIVGIRVSGEIVVGETELETGQRCLQLMKEYCHVTRSLKDCIPIEYDIMVSETVTRKGSEKPGRS